jgi:streptogramin lyase
MVLRTVSPALAAPLAVVGLALASPHVPVRIPTGSHPCEAVAAGGALWVANDGSGTLARVDPKTNRVRSRLRPGRGICAVAAGARAVWAVNYRSGLLLRVDPRTNAVRRIVVNRSPFDVLVAAGQVWTTGFDDGTLVAVDPATSRVARRIELGGAPTGLLFHAGAIWVGLGRDATDILRVDPNSGSVRRIAVGVIAPSHFVATRSGIWVANDGDTLVQVDPADGRVALVTHVGRTLGQPASAPDGSLWVPDKEIDTIFRVDPTTGRVLDSFPGGDGAFQALSAFGSMWVTSYAGGDVWRFRPGR